MIKIQVPVLGPNSACTCSSNTEIVQFYTRRPRDTYVFHNIYQFGMRHGFGGYIPWENRLNSCALEHFP